MTYAGVVGDPHPTDAVVGDGCDLASAASAVLVISVILGYWREERISRSSQLRSTVRNWSIGGGIILVLCSCGLDKSRGIQ